MNRKINKIASRGRIAWLYTKYQLITKGLLALVIFPAAAAILKLLLQSTGRVNISSGDYLKFLLSFQGAGMLLLGLILLILLIGVDINAFIIMSALVHEGRIKITARELLIVGLKSLRSFLRPSGILIMLYLAIAVPLVGLGITISPMKDFQIPNFITEVIFKNTLYSALYFTLLLLLVFITIRYIFTLHYVLLLGNGIGEGLLNAARLMKRYWKVFIKDFAGWLLLWGLALFLTLAALLLLLVLPANLLTSTLTERRIWSIFGFMTASEILAFAALMTVPVICYRLTELFYKYNAQSAVAVVLKMEVQAEELGSEASGKLRLRTKAAVTSFMLVVLIFNFIVAFAFGTFFDELFRDDRSVEIVAHRGGGDLAAENTLAGLYAAIKENAAWSEIDVQRTKDDRYIINHDSNFSRVAGESRSSSELTLAEIKKLRVRDLFDESRPAQEVATIEEFLDAAKGRIGLFIELKGSTADNKMAEDVIAMVKERQMEKEVAFLSLSYELILYIEEKYPEIQTGFLYFFSLGDTAKMKGDILIMEEREATTEKIDEIHEAGKKAIVWTVNTEESIEKFVDSEIDGIITDHVLQVKEGLERRKTKSDLEILINYFLK